MTSKWSTLTSGTTRGTLAPMRKAEELEMTAQPAAANFGSSSLAMGASMDEKMMRRELGGVLIAGEGLGRVGLQHHAGDALGQGRVETPGLQASA